MDWFENSQPWFWKAVFDKRVVGVISAQTQPEKAVRMRGIWVAPELRGQGVGRQLMNQVFSISEQGVHPYVWAMARHDSLDFYKKCGYQEIQKITKYEFGPHFIVKKDFFDGAHTDKKNSITKRANSHSVIHKLLNRFSLFRKNI